MWGVDILGPFTPAGAQVKFVLVAVDYFTKWIEAESMAKITAEKVKMFYWTKIICRFGVPATVVFDNGTQFTSKKVRDLCEEMRIEMRKAKGPTDSKLTPNWEGPYRILRDLGHGAYHLEELSRRRIPRAWNAQHLRYYYS
ncbi:uncharacterized protein LOC130736594 [Lotus japonicus]|uniref:uncharacterized protein LOC130736594 n=1 Tax=Lotus japonicus TaxID=34305 RepID=UPI002585A0B9|nr:uncharacterized protein LOC130736594 [Lotus japonicus]